MILVESTAEMIIVESGPAGPAGPIGGGVSVSSGAGVPASAPLAIGDIYIDTSNDNAYQAVDIVSSADWKQSTGAGGGDLLAGNNLSDLENVTTARTNLGLGDVATTDAADYATAAQGTLADAAAASYPVGRIETGTTYTLAATDHGKLIMFSNSSLVTVTLPANTDVAIPDWFSTMLQSTGAAGMTLDISAITPNGSSPKTTVAQNEGLGPVKTATDTWSIFGGTAA